MFEQDLLYLTWFVQARVQNRCQSLIHRFHEVPPPVFALSSFRLVIYRKRDQQLLVIQCHRNSYCTCFGLCCHKSLAQRLRDLWRLD